MRPSFCGARLGVRTRIKPVDVAPQFLIEAFQVSSLESSSHLLIHTLYTPHSFTIPKSHTMFSVAFFSLASLALSALASPLAHNQ